MSKRYRPWPELWEANGWLWRQHRWIPNSWELAFLERIRLMVENDFTHLRWECWIRCIMLHSYIWKVEKYAQNWWWTLWGSKSTWDILKDYGKVFPFHKSWFSRKRPLLKRNVIFEGTTYHGTTIVDGWIKILWQERSPDLYWVGEASYNSRTHADGFRFAVASTNWHPFTEICAIFRGSWSVCAHIWCMK